MSKNLRDQQATERLHIKEFLRRRGIKGTRRYGDAPDAVLVIDGRRVGLEHCELTEEDLAANRPNIVWLETALKGELVTLGADTDLFVGLGVDARASHYLRKRSTAAALAVRVARLASSLAANVTAESPVSLSIPELEKHGLPGVSALIVKRLADGVGGPHTCVTPGFWGPVESSTIAAVRAKEKRLPAYKAAKALDECWLLLVTGESWVQATDSALTGSLRISSPFDAIYLMDTRTGQLQRVDEREGE